jgi:enoyl-CoA hydratase/carnithine racemase
VHNSFNSLMQRELQTVWRALRRHDPVKCIVLTGAGEKAFCTGIDRTEQMGGERDETTDPEVVGSGSTPVHVQRPGRQHRPEVV